MRPRAVQADDATEEDRPERPTDPGLAKRRGSMVRKDGPKMRFVALCLSWLAGAPFAYLHPENGAAIILGLLTLSGAFVGTEMVRPSGMVKAE